MKRYVRTPASDAVDDRLADAAHRFALGEVRPLARRARETGAKPSSLQQQRARFENHLRLGFFGFEP